MNESNNLGPSKDGTHFGAAGGSTKATEGVLPFPKAEAAVPEGRAAAAGDQDGARLAEDADALAQGWIERAAAAAHRGIDALAGKASSAADGTAKAADAKEAWLDSAREAVRGRPVAAIGIALLVGAGLVALNSSRGR